MENFHIQTDTSSQSVETGAEAIEPVTDANGFD
jgi:hypothetical protein